MQAKAVSLHLRSAVNVDRGVLPVNRALSIVHSSSDFQEFGKRLRIKPTVENCNACCFCVLLYAV